MDKIAVCWLRRDLRLNDNAALYRALRSGFPVLPLFIFDRDILSKLDEPADARVSFIHRTLSRLKQQLEAQGNTLLIRYGEPELVWRELLDHYPVAAVFTNRDYEPYAIRRDQLIRQVAEAKGVEWCSFKDQVIFEEDEILKKDGTPYTVFTPYSRKWKAKLESKISKEGEKSVSYFLQSYPTGQYFDNFLQTPSTRMPSLKEMGFVESNLEIPSATVSRGLIRHYDKTRNIPGIQGTSRLGIHFRFGTISIREKARRAIALNQTYLNELIWRDFYAQILANFPHVAEGAFRPEYEYIEWRNREDEFERWCSGATGFPIVDAGMRELNTTGYMHNRVRMITASFLTKHLLIDWRWGEAYFAKKLLDFDLASNNGGWQWAAGSGTDAAPYFRIFNPYTQQKKFDPEWQYIKKWVPEYDTARYPEPVVDHKAARQRCLEAYKTGIERGKKVKKRK